MSKLITRRGYNICFRIWDFLQKVLHSKILILTHESCDRCENKLLQKKYLYRDRDNGMATKLLDKRRRLSFMNNTTGQQ